MPISHRGRILPANSQLMEAVLASPLLPEIVEAGQRHLEREQLRRQKFYNHITPEHEWEFIQGEVIMHSPALNRHLVASQHFFKLPDAWVSTRRTGTVKFEKAMCVFPRNDYEPDIVFFGPAKSALIDADTLKFPVPDLAVDVLSPSTEVRDRGIKFQDYAAHAVAEYWIIDTVAETVELYRLAPGADSYPETVPQAGGTLVSDVVPGFAIPVRAIFDNTENLSALRRIMSDSEDSP